MTSLLSVLLAMISILAIGFTPLASSLNENRSNRSSFIEALKKGIKSEEMTYSDLQHIAENFNQNRQSILSGLRIMLADAISGDKDLIESIENIRNLLEVHQKNEPFAELPENISLQLADIQDNTNNKKIDQLAASLSTLYISHQRSISKEKNIARAGIVIGILSVIWSVTTYFMSK